MVDMYIMASGFLLLWMFLEILKSDFKNIEKALECISGDFRKNKKKHKSESLYEFIKGNADREFRILKICRILLAVTAASAFIASRVSPVFPIPDITKEILLTGYGITVTVIVFVHHLAVQSWDLIKLLRDSQLVEAIMNRGKDDELL